jgi:hypothetical protein
VNGEVEALGETQPATVDELDRDRQCLLPIALRAERIGVKAQPCRAS